MESMAPIHQIIYYEVRVLDPSRTLPRVTLAKAGEHHRGGSQMHRLPLQKSAILAENPAVISKPLHPDNSRQTILQPNMPPDIRITTEIKLPDVVMNRPVEMPKMPLTFNPSDAKPLQKLQQNVVKAAPSVSSLTNSEMPGLILDAFNSQPRLSIPSFAISKPVQKLRETEIADPGSAPVSETEKSPSLPVVASSDQPRLPMPSFAVAKPVQNFRAEAGAPGGDPSSEIGNDLIIMSVDPSTPVSQIILPPGSRQGEFTISPPGGKTESTGSPNGAASAEGKTASGVATEGISAAGRGNNDRKPGSIGILSIAGEGGKAEALGALGTALPPNMVFPVPSATSLRKNSMVVSAGPTGGGGLNIYGALHCGKIYTIFLSMPGKNWTMQYCAQTDAAEAAPSNSQSMVIHLDQGLVPPDPESRFDYRRLSVPEDKADKTIVLKGILRKDGTVGALKVYQGVLPLMDEAARTAFSRWKFKPAMQGGKPVAVEILVGIPMESGAQGITH